MVPIMKYPIPNAINLAFVFCSLFSPLIFAEPNYPFPQHVKYSPGTIKPTNFTQDEQDKHVTDFYNYWQSTYLIKTGTNANGQILYRVAKGKTLIANAKCENISQDYTVSEGQGYGMVIVALMAGYDADAQTKFDGLWHFSRLYPSSIGNNLMSWCVKESPLALGERRRFEIPAGEENSAFDGDADIAYALLLAHKQWGSNGKINYLQEAKKVLNDILKFTIGRQSNLPKLGDWVELDCVLNNSDDCISERWTQFTPRSSDLMLAHFRSFYRATGNARWLTIIRQSQAVIESIQNKFSINTGLLPDFIINCDSHCKPAKPFFLEAETDGDYSYNAGRDPWRIGLDALLNQDVNSKHAALKMINWLADSTNNNADEIKAEYQLDGTPISNYSTSFFVAPFAIAAMLDEKHQNFLNDMYTFLYQQHEGYYEDSVNLINLLVITGNYWGPTNIDPDFTFDTDEDGIIDLDDNCTIIANPDQRDTDNDGFGNLCDADFDNNGLVSFADLNQFRENFGTSNPDADLDGSGSVSFHDLDIFRNLFNLPPGPAGGL